MVHYPNINKNQENAIFYRKLNKNETFEELSEKRIIRKSMFDKSLLWFTIWVQKFDSCE